MVRYTASFQKIEQDFVAKGLPVESPGFYNHPHFITRERANPEYLNNYARFVADRCYDPEYLERAARIIPAAARALHRELVEDGRAGACIDASGILLKSLERHGIWSFVLKGSLTIRYPSNSGIADQYFYTVDAGDFLAGHAWLHAPPFSVVDVTIRHQRHSATEASYIPDLVLATSLLPAKATPSDLIAPAFRAHFRMQGIPAAAQISAINPDLPKFMKFFPSGETKVGGTRFKYIPCAVSAPDCELDEMVGLSGNGRKGITIYHDSIRPAIEHSED